MHTIIFDFNRKLGVPGEHLVGKVQLLFLNEKHIVNQILCFPVYQLIHNNAIKYLILITVIVLVAFQFFDWR